MSDGRIRRVALPTIAAAVTSALAAVLINFATEWKTSVAAWVVAALLTVLSGAVSFVLWNRQNEAQAGYGGQDSSGTNDIGIRGPAAIRDLRVAGRKNRWRSGSLQADSIVFDAGGPSATTPHPDPGLPPRVSPPVLDGEDEHRPSGSG
jgi:hypothetical protein